MAGHREGLMYKELKHVTPTAAAFGGAILGLLLVAADLSGAIGRYSMAVTIIYGCESCFLSFLFCLGRSCRRVSLPSAFAVTGSTLCSTPGRMERRLVLFPFFFRKL
jgi:hypothetical protein